MAADAWKVYHKTKEYMSDGTMDLDADNFDVALFVAASTGVTNSTSVTMGDLTGEVTATGYVRDTANPITWTESGGTVTFDITTDPAFTASGASIVCHYAVIFNDSTSAPADCLMCYSRLDNSPSDVTVTDGNTLTIQMHTNGAFQVAGGWA
jgi:hypothetical protein